MSNFFKESVTVYTTTRLVSIRTPFIATFNTVFVILIWCSFLMSLNLNIRKIYQSTCPVRGVVLSKVKGFASTENLTNEELNVRHPELYRREWDPADLVYPAQGGEGETGSFTIVTNLKITPNQTLGRCTEAPSSVGKCKEDADCEKGYWSPRTNGIFTGNCLKSDGVCEIKGWCPIEQGNLPLNGKRALLEDVKDFTVMLKNTVEFPECGDQLGLGHNLPNDITQQYLRSCLHDKHKDPLCPIFKIGDIVKWSGDDFSRVAIQGGVFHIKICWACDFDFGKTLHDCKPEYEFIRLDDKDDGLSKGWNFRSAKYFAEDRRTLKKQYGLKILVSLEGEGRRFNFYLFVITLGATTGLFSSAPLICDFLLDVFNMLNNGPLSKVISRIHDPTASRYDKHVVEANASASNDPTIIENNNAEAVSVPMSAEQSKQMEKLGLFDTGFRGWLLTLTMSDPESIRMRLKPDDTYTRER